MTVLWVYGKVGFKALIQLQNKKHTEDWALCCHPRDNGHVIHITCDVGYDAVFRSCSNNF